MYRVATVPILLAAAGAVGQSYTTYQLGDASAEADVQWSALGKINWRPIVSADPWPTLDSSSSSEYDDLFLNSSISPNGEPGMTPYGDVLAYTAQGVGDVDNDGYGDFAITWYTADKDRGEPCDPVSGHPPSWANNPANTTPTVVDDRSVGSGAGQTMDRVGFVRIMSGNPSYANTCADSGDIEDDFSDAHSGDSNDIRRIGAEDFWGGANNAIWSHEITTLGDIDGFPGDEIMLCANSNQVGKAEIWSFTDKYVSCNETVTEKRWVRLLVIEEDPPVSPEKQEEFGYQSFEGPPPNSSYVSLSQDFNNDGQADLMIASKWYRDSNEGHAVNSGGTGTARQQGAGAAWVFLLPTEDVWQEIDRVSGFDSDTTHNRPEMHHSGADDVTDRLPLTMTTDEYSVKIVGSQFKHWSTGINSSKYPRHFGFEVAPAGDIDGDGKLDLAVSAPLHYDDDTYDDLDNWTTDTNSDSVVDEADIPNHAGRLYFFLNDSVVRGDDPWTDLSPKYYYDEYSMSSHKKCGSQLYYFYDVSENSMSGNQVSFYSDDADYVIEGGTPTTSGNPSQAAFAHSFLSGVDLDGTTFSNLQSETDVLSDIAIFHARTNAVYVIRDLYDVLDREGVLDPSSTTVLWDADDSLGPTAHAVFETDTDVFGIRGLTHSTRPTSQLPIYGVRSIGSMDYGAPSGLMIGGDQDNDGDCEIFVGCSSSSNTTYNNPATLLIDIEDLSAMSDASLLAEYLPEDFDWEDSAMYSAGSSSVKYHQSNGFNAGQSQVRAVGMRAWPVWQTGADDTLIGVRQFPRRITQYPSLDVESWLSVPGIGLTSLSGADYDAQTLVPAGKAYYLQNKLP